MSPTLLEGLVALLVIVLAWRIGTELAPLLFRALRRAKDQLERVNQDLTGLEQTSQEKEQSDANSQSQ